MGETWIAASFLAIGAALSGLVLIAAARISPSVWISLYAFVLPFGSAIKLPLGIPALDTLSTAMGVLATASLTLHVTTGRRRASSVDPSVGSWLALLGWLVLSLLWTADPGRSLSALLVLASLIALHTIASLTPFTRKDLRLLELAIVGGALVVVGRAVLLAATGRLHETASRIPRFTFDEGDPNHTAATLLLALVLTAWWALHGRSTTARTASLGASSLILVGIALAGSRGGLVAAAVGLVAVFAQSLRLPPGRFAVFLLPLAIVGVVAVQLMPAQLQNHLRATHSTGRMEIWEVGLHACKETCLLGNGVGTFGSAYRYAYYSDLSLPGNGDRLWSAHNTFLSMLVEGGLVGGALLIVSLLLLVTSLRRLPNIWRGPPLAALAALLASNMFITSLGFKYFWLTITFATLTAQVHRRAASAPFVTPAADRSAARRFPR